MTIDKKKCIGCVLCNSFAEEVLEMDDSGFKARVKKEAKLTKENIEKVKEAALACPSGAIKISA